ncbi:hypothetical protein BDY21DRAFT_342041 [Lineolata rhizophorae]|uniref:Uncharacterized protein n=1 Tax=Lineolata rhizophorae TaxID=578093 RepID=A0A6A6P397_9PEZI|nr:hypothetical protein BDY21DRAFT_342041 [Lineolata rhizophorae]
MPYGFALVADAQRDSPASTFVSRRAPPNQPPRQRPSSRPRAETRSTQTKRPASLDWANGVRSSAPDWKGLGRSASPGTRPAAASGARAARHLASANERERQNAAAKPTGLAGRRANARAAELEPRGAVSYITTHIQHACLFPFAEPRTILAALEGSASRASSQKTCAANTSMVGALQCSRARARLSPCSRIFICFSSI